VPVGSAFGLRILMAGGTVLRTPSSRRPITATLVPTLSRSTAWLRLCWSVLRILRVVTTVTPASSKRSRNSITLPVVSCESLMLPILPSTVKRRAWQSAFDAPAENDPYRSRSSPLRS